VVDASRRVAQRVVCSDAHRAKDASRRVAQRAARSNAQITADAN
jgi:hypothetical protein